MLFNEVLRLRGVEVFASSVALVQKLRTGGRRVAVVTSSKNCDAVPQAAGIQNLVEARVDGNVVAEKKLVGKPAPETYQEVARMLGTLPEQAVVIEDATSGIQAGRTGGLGLVIGVAGAATRRFSARRAPTSLSATLQNLAQYETSRGQWLPTSVICRMHSPTATS